MDQNNTVAIYDAECALTADGFDKAKIGVLRRASQQDIVVYDYQRCVDILKARGEGCGGAPPVGLEGSNWIYWGVDLKRS